MSEQREPRSGASAAPAPPPGPAGTTTPLKGIRRTIARRMQQAWAVPVFHLVRGVDMTRLVGPERPAGASVTDVILAASARALREHPGLNAYLVDEAITVLDEVNIGVAVATDAGLMVPVIHGADRLSLADLTTRRRDLAERARTGRLTMADVDGGTFTVSSLGMLGVDRFDAILNIPQVAILAVGATQVRWVRDGEGGRWQPTAELTLTCDHRAVDGAVGAGFLATLVRLLEAGAPNA